MLSTQVTSSLKCVQELWETWHFNKHGKHLTWKAFIQAKVEYLSFEKIQEIISENNRRAKKELNEFFAQMVELDKEATVIECFV